MGKYRDFQMDPECLTASVKVRNTGDRAGRETVQLYFRDCVSSVLTPIKSLIAFRQVDLEPGEEKTVTFNLRRSDFSIVNRQEKDRPCFLSVVIRTQGNRNTGFEETTDFPLHPGVPEVVRRMAVVRGQDRAVEILEDAVLQLVDAAPPEEMEMAQHRRRAQQRHVDPLVPEFPEQRAGVVGNASYFRRIVTNQKQPHSPFSCRANVRASAILSSMEQ